MVLKKRANKIISTDTKNKGIIKGAGEIVEEKIVNTIENNYMPYAMSVIMSRAIPEIDGFKPSHRKLLFTMYKMGLLNSSRTKSANIVGQTMKLNPHGDSAIYDTMVRLSRGYEALLHPYVDSKGNFGKFYSRDMAWAASRYTEAKLDNICNELFKDIDKDTVDFVDNYDNTLKEPTLLPASFPSVLVNANTGIAVGMASSICPFNLKEVCETTIELIKNDDHEISSTLIAPDFPGGGQIIYDRKSMESIYNTGRGSIKVRSKYLYDKSENCIDIISIPPTTTTEAIIDKTIELIKAGKIKEISDIRDETGINGLKITIDLKRGVDADKLMQKLYKFTTLEDTFSCNFNMLINGIPKVLGTRDILREWISFRVSCIKRRTKHDLVKKLDRLHLLNGLKKILLDIDKAIKIIRNTLEENDVVPNLMIGFGIDQVQAEYVAEIKLRNLNREYIIKRTNEIDSIEKEVKDLNEILGDDMKVKMIIISELFDVSKKYSQPRRSMLIYQEDIENLNLEEEIPDYNVTLFITEGGYFKKITPQSLRMNSEQKIKEDDSILQVIESTNSSEILFFTNKCQVYKSYVYEFNDSKASLLGDYIPAKLELDEDEKIVCVVSTKDYSGFMMFFFENGRVAKVDMKSYYTKTRRKKLIGAYSDKASLIEIIYSNADLDCLLTSTSGRMLVYNSSIMDLKSTRTTQGIYVMTLRKSNTLLKVEKLDSSQISNFESYRSNKIPAPGLLPKTANEFEGQLKI